MLLRIGVPGMLIVMVYTRNWFLLGWATLMLVCFMLQRNMPARCSRDVARGVFGAMVVMQCVLSIFAAVVTHYTGAYLIATGMLANTIAILANDLRMPIRGGSSDNVCYMEAGDRTRVVWLCDLFRTTETSWAKWIISLGDALECIGIWVMTAEILIAPGGVL